MSTLTDTGTGGRKSIALAMQCIAEGNEEKASALISEYMTETARHLFTDGIEKMLSPADAGRGRADVPGAETEYDDGGETAGFRPPAPDPTDKFVDDIPFASPDMTGDEDIDAALADHGFGPESISTIEELEGIGGDAGGDIDAYVRPRMDASMVPALEAADPSKGKGKSPDRSSKSDDLVKEITTDKEEIEFEKNHGDVKEGTIPASYLFRTPAAGNPVAVREADGDNRDDEEIEQAEKDLQNEMGGEQGGQDDSAREPGPDQENIGVGSEESGNQGDLGQEGGTLDDQGAGADGDPGNGEAEVTDQDMEEKIDTAAAVAEKIIDDAGELASTAGAIEDAIGQLQMAYDKKQEEDNAQAGQEGENPQDPDAGQGEPEGGQEGGQPEDGEGQPDYGVGNQGGQQAQQEQDGDDKSFFPLDDEEGQGNGQNQEGRT